LGKHDWKVTSVTAPRTRRRTYANTSRTYATIPTTLWTDPQFQQLSAVARRVYLVIRTVPTTGQAGVTDLRPDWWAGLLGDTEDDICDALDELENIGWVWIDVETRELIATCMVDEEAATRDGDAVERIARQGEAARSEDVRVTVAGSLVGINHSRARVAADHLLMGLPLPERGRVSLLTREELQAARVAFANCPDRAALRAEINAGMHRCAHCGCDGTEKTEGRFINLTVDHIVSLARMGKSERSNYQVLCADCNGAKGAL
jgi:HNH endonuclease